MEDRSFSDQIRHAVDASGMSRYAICKAIELPESSMSRFMNRKSGLNLATLDRLAELIGLAVVVKPARRKGKG
jgi:hypothetical protein